MKKVLYTTVDAHRPYKVIGLVIVHADGVAFLTDALHKAVDAHNRAVEDFKTNFPNGDALDWSVRHTEDDIPCKRINGVVGINFHLSSYHTSYITGTAIQFK